MGRYTDAQLDQGSYDLGSLIKDYKYTRDVTAAVIEQVRAMKAVRELNNPAGHKRVVVTTEHLMRTLRSEEIDTTERERFLDYLQNTLIPDLRESGSDATADDFETCIRYMVT